jgi:hypothetical protein
LLGRLSGGAGAGGDRPQSKKKFRFLAAEKAEK